MSKASKTSPAFTLVELMVAIPMVIVVLGIIIGLMIALVGNVITSNAKNQMIYDVQTALNQIEQDAFLSTSFVNTYTAPSPQMKNDTSGIYDATPAAGVTPDIVFNQLGTTKNPMDPDRGIVYYARPNSCDVDKQAANDPFFLKVAYFVRSGVLYKRTIVPLHNTNTGSPNGDTVCDDPWQRGSCTEGYAANVRCETKDTKLLEGVDSLNVTYFNKATPGTAVSDAGNADSIRATITLQRKSAGDTHSYSGGVSATRTNSLPTATAVPGTPVISLSGDYPPGGAVFTWRPVPNASSYDVRYSVNNGASWSAIKSIPATQTELKYDTVEATGTENIFGGETVRVSVTAKNELGTRSSEATFAIPVWKPCDPAAPVTTYGGGFAQPAYTYTQAKVVLLKGLVRNASGSNTGICSIPKEYAPSHHYIFRGYTSTYPSYTEVYPSGEVKATNANNGWHTLDGIAFLPKNTSYTWQNFTMQSGWCAWATGYVHPRYAIDSVGRFHIDAMIGCNGTKTDNTVMATAPIATISLPYQHLAAASSGTSTGTGTINTAGLRSNGANLEILTKGNNVDWLSVHTMAYQTTAPWANMSYSPGFSTRSGFPAAQYIIGSDGIVMLRGLININTAVTARVPVASLPHTACPSETLIIPVNSHNATGTLTVSPSTGSGCTVNTHSLANNSAGSFFALDGMLWRVGQ